MQEESNDFHSAVEVLGRIADQYSQGSSEYEALLMASKALSYLWERSIAKQFVKYCKTCDQPLTPLQREHLKELGLTEEDRQEP